MTPGLPMLDTLLGSTFSSDESLRNLIEFRSAASDPIGPQPGRRKVLVVDDQRLIADTISEILDGAGFQVKAAYDGWSALDIAGRFHPDYVLSDVLMPRMNGVELAIAV